MFAVIHASLEETTGDDTAIEIIENRPFSNECGLPSGQYTHKIIHLAKRLPSIWRALAPESMLKVEERSWNAFPNIHMVYRNQFLGDRFEIRIDSKHFPDRGDSENVSFSRAAPS